MLCEELEYCAVRYVGLAKNKSSLSIMEPVLAECGAIIRCAEYSSPEELPQTENSPTLLTDFDRGWPLQ